MVKVTKLSRIGKMPVKLPQGVTASVESRLVTITGPKGSLSLNLFPKIEASIGEDKILVTSKGASRNLLGLTRSLIANMVRGVEVGFSKRLELSGVGYRAQVTGDELIINCGFSHPVKIKAPQGIFFTTGEGKIEVSGVDKQLVGEVAAKIRKIRPADPYKGKGIKYEGEKIRRKAGKAKATIGAPK